MSGGKGGGSTTTQKIPEWAEEPTKRNLRRAEMAQQVGYMPYMGPDVVGFTPTQEAAFQNTLSDARAFGLAAPTEALAGMPQTTNFGGVNAYSAYPIFDQAREELRLRDPEQVARYDALFGNEVPPIGE